MEYPYQLPSAFLSSPRPEITKQIIDFSETELPEYKGHYACILDDVLSADECANLLRAAKAQTNGEWHHATINSGSSSGGGGEVDAESRSCGRIIWDEKALASKIWARCHDHVPEIRELEVWNAPFNRTFIYEVAGLSERMRFLRYFDGSYFKREKANQKQGRQVFFCSS